jgi:hypothetical protein
MDHGKACNQILIKRQEDGGLNQIKVFGDLKKLA